MMDLRAYHQLELQIATTPGDSRRVMPPLRDHHRAILDIGCGAGQTLIASGLRPDVTSVGIDFDLEALALGKQIDGGMRLVCARGEALPVRSGSFDMVISRVALPYMRTAPALAEMTRVLKPGGTLWLVLHPFRQVMDEIKTFARKLEVRPILHRLYVIANGVAGHFADVEFASPIGRFETFQTERGIRRRLGALDYRDVAVRHQPFFVVTATKSPAAA